MKVPYDKITWEDAYCAAGALYNNKKFTGIAYEETDDCYHEYSFLDGDRHGHHYGINNVTQEILWEEFYEHEMSVKTHFGWKYPENPKKYLKKYEDGIIVFAQIEDEYGRLLFEYNKKDKEIKSWYENGQQSFHKCLEHEDNPYQFSQEMHWNEDGVWLMTVKEKVNFEFNHHYLMQHTHELHTTEQELIIIEFSKYLIAHHTKTALYYLHELIYHSKPFYRYHAAWLLGKVCNQSSIRYLEDLLDDHLQPETDMYIDWKDSGHSSKAACTIAEMAKTTIEKIHKKTAET